LEEPLEEALSPGSFQKINPSKREMDNIKLTSELKEIKEKLLDYVNEIVIR
jgi:hypothetical protein